MGFGVLDSIWVLPGGYHESVFHFVHDSYIWGARVCDYNDDATGERRRRDDFFSQMLAGIAPVDSSEGRTISADSLWFKPAGIWDFLFFG